MKPSTGQNVLRSCPSSPASSADAESGLSIVDVVQMLVRRKWFIVGSTLVCGLAAFVYSRTIIPEYEATATIRIDQERANSLGLGDLGAEARVVRQRTFRRRSLFCKVTRLRSPH
jgi:uncharacterized protein involved in exopolysaccharide biosynthesis